MAKVEVDLLRVREVMKAATNLSPLEGLYLAAQIIISVVIHVKKPTTTTETIDAIRGLYPFIEDAGRAMFAKYQDAMYEEFGE